MFVHQFEVKSAQTTVELAWQANNMDGLQQKYECCGKSSAQDYVHLRQLIPPSCYIDLDQKPEHLYVEGCIEKLQSRYESDKLRFIIVSWVLVAFEVTIDSYFQYKFLIEFSNDCVNCFSMPHLQLLCFVIAVFLAISFRNKQRRLQF